LRRLERRRLLFVAAGLAVGNLRQSPPDAFLKRRSFQIKWHIKGSAAAGKIFRQLLFGFF
jgi:hypothetical protein